MDDRHAEARRALVLHDLPLVVDLIELTLNHGLFAVRAASSIEEAERILADWLNNSIWVIVRFSDSIELLRQIGSQIAIPSESRSKLGKRRLYQLNGNPLSIFNVACQLKNQIPK